MRKRFVEAVILVVHRRYKIRKQFRLAARFIARQDFRGRGRQTTITNMPPFLRFSLARLKNQHNCGSVYFKLRSEQSSILPYSSSNCTVRIDIISILCSRSIVWSNCMQNDISLFDSKMSGRNHDPIRSFTPDFG